MKSGVRLKQLRLNNSPIKKSRKCEANKKLMKLFIKRTMSVKEEIALNESHINL